MTESSRVLDIFHTLIWVVVTWIDVCVTVNRTTYLRCVSFTLCYTPHFSPPLYLRLLSLKLVVASGQMAPLCCSALSHILGKAFGRGVRGGSLFLLFVLLHDLVLFYSSVTSIKKFFSVHDHSIITYKKARILL